MIQMRAGVTVCPMGDHGKSRMPSSSHQPGMAAGGIRILSGKVTVCCR